MNEPLNKLAFLALVVALSAYLASVRLSVIARLSGSTPPRNPKKLKTFIVLLMPADIFLVVAGLFLGWDLVVRQLSETQVPAAWLYPAAVMMFFFAIIILAAHHAVSWYISVRKWLKD